MADQAEDVLELEDELEPEIEPEEGDADPSEEATEDEPQDEEGEPFVGFADEAEDEAAPASESDSSVIREMRRKIRERDQELARLRKSVEPKPIEVGPEPDIEDDEFSWDKDKWRAAWDAWKARKDQAEAQQREADEANAKAQAAFAKKVEAFDAEKAGLGIANFEEVEAEIASSLPQETVAAIMHTGKPAALMAALHKSPGKLEQLSKLNLLEAAMMLGKLEAQVTVGKRKSKPQPDRAIQGRTASGGDKELKRLEREAERTGDRTALIRYRKQMSATAK